jgi:hypothetical protein
MINLKNVLRPGGPFTQGFIIKRPTTTWVLGGITQAAVSIPALGAVTVAKERDLVQVPEADRVTGAMLFISVTEMRVTRLGAAGAGSATSDTIVWRGDTYRLAKLWPYADYGFYRALGVRVGGA